MNNDKLNAVYDKAYKKNAYKNFFTFNSYFIFKAILSVINDWRGYSVIDVGSGEGDLAALLSIAGADSVYSLDYSEEAIDISKKRYSLGNVKFVHQNVNDCKEVADVIVMAGVLEHIDDPFGLLLKLFKDNLKNSTGKIITASPSFINPRGYIWMALQELYDVPMSLTDIHFFVPGDFYTFAEDNGLKCDVSTIDSDWGCGERLIHDFKKRLPNALKDRGLDYGDPQRLIKFLEKTIKYVPRNEYSGAIQVVTLERDL